MAMAKKPKLAGAAADLRKRSESRVSPKEVKVARKPPALDDTKQMLCELQVYQIELERQNEELRRTQGELEASRARYFDLYDLAPIGFITVNNEGLILEVNLAAATLFGVTRGALFGQPFTRFIHPEDRVLYDNLRRQGGGGGQTLELRILPAKTGLLWVHLRLASWLNDECKIILSDITERQQALESLRLSEKFGEEILASVDEAFVVIDREFRILKANRAYCEQTGKALAAIIGKHCYELSHQADEPCHGPNHVCGGQHTFATGEPVVTVHTHADEQGRQRQVEVKTFAMKGEAGEVISVIELINDITDKIALEGQLRQAQKMEAIGTLAGGIAHDFNNILTAILGFGEIVMEGLEPDSPLREDQGQVIKAGQRAKDLVKQILTFSRRSEQQLQPLLVQFVVKEALKLLRASIPTSIEIREDIDVNCGLVMADPGQIHQVVMNLCTNAYQAMRETGGVLAVSLSSLAISEAEAVGCGNLAPGKYVILEVSDTGGGMSRAVRERIFEPYFTTKAKGEGTGLGLSLVHGIATGLGGVVNVYSEPGRGATFKVYLPLIAGAVIGQPELKSEIPRGGDESILVLDDEAAISNLECRLLEGLGYRVTVFADSEEALRAFRDQPAGFDLILTDMTMPRLNGAELAKEVLRIRPGMPIILCTGFSDLINAEKAKALGIREFMLKPVEKGELARAVRRVLDGGSSEST